MSKNRGTLCLCVHCTFKLNNNFKNYLFGVWKHVSLSLNCRLSRHFQTEFKMRIRAADYCVIYKMFVNKLYYRTIHVSLLLHRMDQIHVPYKNLRFLLLSQVKACIWNRVFFIKRFLELSFINFLTVLFLCHGLA